MVLPEMWNCPYSNDSFPTYAEDVEGGASPSAAMLADAAAANKVVLVSCAPGSDARLGLMDWAELGCDGLADGLALPAVASAPMPCFATACSLDACPT